MGWVAEILRKKHRLCERCRLGPVHFYFPTGIPAAGTSASTDEESKPTPLCTTCLATDLARDFRASGAKGLLFEPALGPDAMVFHSLNKPPASNWPSTRLIVVQSALERIEKTCADCDRASQFVWVPVERDANLWSEHWIDELGRGKLTPSASLCGECAARRLSHSIQDRGLFFEAIVPPFDGDGVMFGTES